MGLLWYYKRKFKDFILELEWKTSSKGDNSGVFVRFPNAGNDPYVADRYGYEIRNLIILHNQMVSLLSRVPGAIYETAISVYNELKTNWTME